MPSSSESDSEDGSYVAERRSMLFAVPTAAVRASMDTARRVSSNNGPERLSVNTMRRKFLASEQDKAVHVTRLSLVMFVLFGWLALVNGEPHRPTDILPAEMTGAAAISDAQKCMATFSTLDFDVENLDKYDEYFKDDSTLTLAQAGTYSGVEGITEYMAFASNRSPYILNTKLTNVDVQFEKYNGDTGICEFAFHLTKYGETDPKHSRAVIAEYALVLSVKFDMNQKYIKHIGVYFPVGFLSYFFDVIHNTDKTRDFVCSIISDTCSTVLDDPSLKAKNGEECAEKLSKLPTTEGPLKYFDSNSQGCRVLHAVLATERPENHCPHISLTPIPDLNNKIKCQNSTGYLPENQISAKQLQYHKDFMVDNGFDQDLGYKVYDCKGDCTGVPDAALAINETGGGAPELEECLSGPFDGARDWNGGYVLMKDGDELHSCCDCRDDWYFVPNSDIFMKQRSNGNLIVRKGVPGRSIVVWSSGGRAKDVDIAYTRLQRDGNLITREGSGKPGKKLWKTGTTNNKSKNYFLGLSNNLRYLQIWKGTPKNPKKLVLEMRTRI